MSFVNYDEVFAICCDTGIHSEQRKGQKSQIESMIDKKPQRSR